MSLLVKETGMGVDNSNTYVTVTDVDVFCGKLGITVWNSYGEKEREEAIFRAMSYIESLSFQGYKVFPVASYPYRRLKWPRYEVYDEDGNNLDYTVIPEELKNAVCRASYEEVIDPGCLQINLKRDSYTRVEKIGSLQIEYEPGRNKTIFQMIDGYLGWLITPAGIRIVRT